MPKRLRRARPAISAVTLLSLVGSMLTVLSMIASPSLPFASASTMSTTTMSPTADGGSSAGWAKVGTCVAGYYLCVNDHPDAGGTNAAAAKNITNNSRRWFKFGTTPADLGVVTSVDVAYYAKQNSAGLTGSMDTVTLAVQMYMADETTIATTPTTSAALTTGYSLYTATLTPNNTYNGKTTADTWHLKFTQGYTAVGGGDTTAQAYISSVQITVHYQVAPGVLSQNGYIWENDDQASAANADSDTAQAAGNTAITGVKKGERLNLRTQLKGATTTTASDVGLFYDRNDNYWTKVRSQAAPITSAGSCTDTNFSCTAVAGHYATAPSSTHVAVDSNGIPWVSFYDSNAQDLIVANYVGIGGTGCGANGSTAWNCETVVSTGDVGKYNNIVFDGAGHLWVGYYDTNGSGEIHVAEHIAGSGCASSSWTCTLVDYSAMDAGGADQLGMAVDPSGAPWMAYGSGGTLEYIARYAGSGGTGCPGAPAWTGCGQVDGGTMSEISLAIDANGNTGILVNGATNGIVHDLPVGGGGSTCTNAAYSCIRVSPALGEFPSAAYAPDGTFWGAYHETSSDDLIVARYVGAGGSNCQDAKWDCTVVDGSVSAHGSHTAMAFDPAGHAWVTYQDTTAGTLRLARYVGSGGTGCETGLTTWTCSTIDSLSSKTIGAWSSIAFAPDGTAWISTVNATDKDVRVINLNRHGEIVPAPGLGGNANGVSITSSHSDMTAVGDSANKADADCSGGGTWSNGKWLQSDEASGMSIASGNCTEVAFSIDTFQAQSATTYRFVVATKDSTNYSRSYWRGPGTLSQIPLLTTEASTTTQYSKDSMPAFANCTDTSWGCEKMFDGGSSVVHQLAFAPDGTPWVTTRNPSNDDVFVAHYVGSGGTGCTGGYTDWTCENVEDVGGFSAIAFAPDGTPWMAYTDFSSVKIAKRAGSGGCTGSASASWTCSTIDAVFGDSPLNLRFDNMGNAVIGYYDGSANFRVATAAGSSTLGTGCSATTTWTCVTVAPMATPSATGDGPSIAISKAGDLWGMYVNTATDKLMVAHYVGVGGSGCSITSWTCANLDSTATTGHWGSITMDNDGAPAIVYRYGTGTSLRYAHYVGTGGSGCAIATIWSCVTIDTQEADSASVAFDPSNAPWIAYNGNAANNLRVARYVGGSSGTGCASSSAWNCSTVDSSGWSAVGAPRIAFNTSGVPWISYRDSSGNKKIAKMHLPPVRSPALSTAAVSGLRYRLDAGLSPRTSTCSATAGNKGYCGVSANDSDYDSMAAAANQIPMYSFSSRSASNAAFPSYKWIGQSSVAPSSKNVKIEVYRFGTTNAWTTLATDSTTGANADLTLTGTASAGSASEYWEADGSNYWTYYRVYQMVNTSAETLKTNDFEAITNTAPSSPPSSLAQTRTSTGSLATGDWTSETSVRFTGTVTDADNPDTDALCVEIKAVGVAFANTEDACGTGVAYSGSAVAATVTISGLVSGTQYHWQARTKDVGGLYSSWAAYGGNGDPNGVDVGVDTAAPSTGTVYDGTSAGSDAAFNSGSLSQLSANWSGFGDVLSGISSYDYSIGTSAGATDVTTWTSNSTTTSVTKSGLSLRTGQMYFFNVRANDAATNTSTVVSSNGQVVAPTLTFTVSAGTMAFGGLNAGNSYMSTQTLNVTTSTNAYSGYVVRQYNTQLLTYGSNTIPAYAGTYASPTTWTGTGFGYTSSDTAIQAAGNLFSGATKYAGLTTSRPGDIVADHTATVSGTPISNEAFTLTYKLVSSSTQPAGSYATTIGLGVTATY